MNRKRKNWEVRIETLARTIGVLIAVAVLVLVSAMPICADQGWAVYMSVTTNPNVGTVPGENYHFGFGVKDGASDGFNSQEGDDIAPPDPIVGINAYFYYKNNPPYQRNLIMSVTGPAANITWPLRVKLCGKTGNTRITISWPGVGSVPARYAVLELQTTAGASLADMRRVSNYTFSASEGETYSFQIRAQVQETAQYDLTINSTAGGSVTTPGEGTFTYAAGTVVALVATPDAGYRFVKWTGDVGTIANVNSASTKVTMNGDYSVTANFVTVEVPSPGPPVIPSVRYDLTISSAEGGSVTTPGEGKFTYHSGTVVNLVATADAGHRFVRWTGDVATIADVNAARTTLTMNGNYSIRANFERIPPPIVQHHLTISSTAGGSVTSPGEGTFTYDAGRVVSLVATPSAGYRFVEWTGDVRTIANVNAASTTITMNGDYSIRANFEKIRPPSNWPLSGGIIAAVVVAGLVVFFVHRRKAA